MIWGCGADLTKSRVHYLGYSLAPYTRIIEHKHFEFGKQDKTIISREYPLAWSEGQEPYYPINNESNDKLYAKYKSIPTNGRIIFGGRLGEYKYYDMDQVIAAALAKARELLSCNS